MTDCIPSASDHRGEIQKMQERLNIVAQSGANKACADCNAPYPTWASLLEPAYDGGKRMGLLCCTDCYGFHFRLGKDVCQVKSIKIAADWREEDIQVLKESGNQMVNDAYEAKLEDIEDIEKEAVVRRKQEDREQFIRDKYKHREYFCEKACRRASDRLCRHRKRAKCRKSKSPCRRADSSRRKVPDRSVSLDGEIFPPGASGHRKTPNRTVSLDDDLCCCDQPSLDKSPAPSRDGDRRRLDGKKSSSSRHLGESRPTPPYRSRSSASTDQEGRDRSDHPSRARPKVQRAASSRDGMSLKRESSLRALDTNSSHGLEKKDHQSMSNIKYEGGIDPQSSDPVRTDSPTKGSETIPSSSGHGERRRKKMTTSPPVPKRRGSCTGALNTSHHSAKSASSSSKENEIPSSSGHGERRRKKRTTSPMPRRRGSCSSGHLNTSPHSSSSVKESEIPSSSAHGEKCLKKRGERNKGERKALPERSVSNSSGQRNERRGSLGYGQTPSARRGSLGYDQPSDRPNDRRGSLGPSKPSDRRGSLGQGRQRRRRNSLDLKNIPDSMGDQEIELPTAEERQSWNHSKLEKITARRQKGRLGSSVATLEWHPEPESESVAPTEDVEPDTQVDVPSREELGYGDDTPEEVHEKKKTSWTKKLVKLATGGKATDKKKGDKAAEASATNNAKAIPCPEQSLNTTALVA